VAEAAATAREEGRDDDADTMLVEEAAPTRLGRGVTLNHKP
jgi:hypothetical protein